MIKKNTNNNLFDVLNWVLKNNKKIPENAFQSNFILNRWLSMASIEIAQIVNVTGNRWSKNIKDLSLVNFYHSILPKFTKKIEYIKKDQKNLENENLKILAENMELSIKDIIFLEKSLEEMSSQSK
jgi:hypothetical protein